MNQNPKTFHSSGRSIPFYHFLFEGEFHQSLKVKGKVFKDGARVNSFFNQQIFEQCDAKPPAIQFRRAAMLLIHYFSDYTGRDLDNYYYKPVIDSIRKNGIIHDDTWMDLSQFFVGDYAEKEYLEVFIIPQHALLNFLTEFMLERFSSDECLKEVICMKDLSIKEQKTEGFW